MRSSRHVRATRTAISPRFAISTFRIVGTLEALPGGGNLSRAAWPGKPEWGSVRAGRIFAFAPGSCERFRGRLRRRPTPRDLEKIMKRFLLALITCAAACKPAADAPSAPKGSVIVLGQLIDRTGSIATPSWADSIRLAVNHANQALKQAGKSVRFEIAEANSGNAPDMARAGALQLVKQQNAKAIITDSSQDDIGVNMLNYDGDASHQLDVPIVCMACTSPA